MHTPGINMALARRQLTPTYEPPEAAGPSGIASFLQTPGLREGMLAAGLRLLASDQKRETFGQALYDAVPQGIAAYEHVKGNAEYNTLLNDQDMPEPMRAVLRSLGRERGLPLLVQGMMAGPPDPVALGENERLVSPTGEILVDAVPDVPEPPKRDIRNVGDSLVEVTDAGVEPIYTAPDAGPDATEVGALRDDFERNIAPYEQAAQAFRKMEASATGEATPAKDIALIFNYMKAIDPSSSVREGEYATAQNAGSAFDIVGNFYNRLLTGQRLNDTQRAEFLNSAREQIASQLSQYQTVADQYRGIAESNRYNPAEVIRNPFAGLNLALRTAGVGNDPLGIR